MSLSLICRLNQGISTEHHSHPGHCGLELYVVLFQQMGVKFLVLKNEVGILQSLIR